MKRLNSSCFEYMVSLFEHILVNEAEMLYVINSCANQFIEIFIEENEMLLNDLFNQHNKVNI